MSNGVFTRMKRFQFVEKTAGEVGAATVYSAPVTVAQLEELFYRVRDTKFVSGSVRVDGIGNAEDEGEPGWYEVRFTGYEHGSNLVEAGEGSGFVDFDTPSLTAYFSQRAYSMIEYEPRPSALPGFSGYFSDSYTVDSTLFGEGLKVLDLEEERGMWIPGSSDYVFFLNMEQVDTSMNDTGFVAGFTGSNYDAAEDQALVDIDNPGYNISVFRECTTAFSSRLAADSYDYEDFYGFTSSADLGQPLQFVGYVGVDLSFSKQIAWVDVDGSGNPFSAGNLLYLPVYFSLITDQGGLGIGSGLKFYGESYAIPESSVCNLVLNMVSGPITVPLFVRPLTFLDSVSESGEDFVMQATEWWPYAKDSPAVPVWDKDTGLKV